MRISTWAVVISLCSFFAYAVAQSFLEEDLFVDTAKNYVRMHLKYPHDAEFGPAETKYFSEAEGFFVVTGTVKAMNGLGAKHTHKYSVIVDDVPGEGYKPNYCKFDPPLP